MSAPYACKECARPMYFPKEEQLCASCEEKYEERMKKKYSKR